MRRAWPSCHIRSWIETFNRKLVSMPVKSPPLPKDVSSELGRAADPRHLPYWRGLSKAAKRIMLNRFARSGALAVHTLDVESLRARPITGLRARSIAAFGVPTNIRVNNPAEDTGAGNHTTQSESSIGVRPPFVVVTFNDSNPVAGFSGYANSVDAGMTFNDDIDLSTSSNDSGDGVVAVDRSGTV